ncbi:DNA polymerase epsilon noncatalytic subunit [Zygosaccharomyces mellis]|uniref:DNA polymerase epsilon subunit D n=1 Tax=Zygosaccharomyces mellis TaxID=42258 RepID=A0A4C2E0L7_9SACH|nr:DNA polymerase epsilon noncatalytic subunit [Zygosaccharomyces mellis]
MPPKGWRKDAQGNYPTTSYIKEQENITIQDLLFLKSVITNLAKDINHGDKKLMINKDAILALQRSATVFVNHLLMFARENSKNQDRKSCNINDILDGLDQIGFGGFKTILSTKMVDYQRALELRKINRSRKPLGRKSESPQEQHQDEPQEVQEEQEAQEAQEAQDESNKTRKIDHS